jgi:hypothetical protein
MKPTVQIVGIHLKLWKKLMPQGPMKRISVARGAVSLINSLLLSILLNIWLRLIQSPMESTQMSVSIRAS